LELVNFVDESRIVSCQGNNTRWFRPDGTEVTETKGRVHIEAIKGETLRLMFDRIEIQDQGKWTCVSDEDDQNFKFFTMIVYGLFPATSYCVTRNIGKEKRQTCGTF